jgi:hypothetical protein
MNFALNDGQRSLVASIDRFCWPSTRFPTCTSAGASDYSYKAARTWRTRRWPSIRGSTRHLSTTKTGRQLDWRTLLHRGPAPIADALCNRIEMHMDCGIRSSQHVLKAIALVVRVTYIGRAILYGLSAMREEWVEATLKVIHKELDLSIPFCGRPNISKVD